VLCCLRPLRRIGVGLRGIMHASVALVQRGGNPMNFYPICRCPRCVGVISLGGTSEIEKGAKNGCQEAAWRKDRGDSGCSRRMTYNTYSSIYLSYRNIKPGNLLPPRLVRALCAFRLPLRERQRPAFHWLFCSFQLLKHLQRYASSVFPPFLSPSKAAFSPLWFVLSLMLMKTLLYAIRASLSDSLPQPFMHPPTYPTNHHTDAMYYSDYSTSSGSLSMSGSGSSLSYSKGTSKNTAKKGGIRGMLDSLNSHIAPGIVKNV